MRPLSVLKTSPATSTLQLVRLFHQSQLEWARHLGTETELDFGRWIVSPHLPNSPVSNCLLDAYLLPGRSAGELIAEMNDRSQQVGTPWRCCVLNPSMPAEQTQPLADELLEKGWNARPMEIFHRGSQASLAVNLSKDSILSVKMIPARASFSHYQKLMELRQTPDAHEAMLHLDDPHFDALLALKNGNGVGSIGLLTTGEVGTIQEWYIAPGEQNSGLDRLLLHRAMEIATRGLLRHVMIGLPGTATEAIQIGLDTGFAKIGQWVSFWKDSCITA